MREYVQLLAAAALMLLLIPLVGLAQKRSSVKAADSDASETVRIYLTQSGDTLTLSMHDYIVAAVMAQMPADFEPEALEAQAVLAATYARGRRANEQTSPTADLHGADMSDDGNLYQAFFTEDQARTLYGDEYRSAKKKISAAADTAEKLTLTYDGAPALVAFHAISSGHTESALDVWGEDIPYLRAVGSEWDSELDECITQTDFSAEELAARLSGEFDEDEKKISADSPFAPESVTENGTVLTVSVGSDVNIYPAERFCKTLGLRSQNFTAELKNGRWKFTVRGSGHLVGMSQFGANEMAKQGHSCAEILLHYFPGTTLSRAETDADATKK